MNGEYQELPVACRVNNVPRATYDAKAEEGDVPKVRVIAGRVVVDADEFRAWALRIRAEQAADERGCEGCE